MMLTWSILLIVMSLVYKGNVRPSKLDYSHELGVQVGFGFYSLIEVTSGAVLLWRLYADVDALRGETCCDDACH